MIQKAAFSIIIPVLNEAQGIGAQLTYVLNLPNLRDHAEIIVVDGGSSDETRSIAGQYSVKIIESSAGRSRQMNVGARAAHTKHLFFLHADSMPPVTFVQDVLDLIQLETVGGCYRLAFDDRHPVLRLYAWVTRFDVQAFRFGDQGLYVPAEVFESIGGFNESYLVMEDNDIVKRLRKYWQEEIGRPLHDFTILPDEIITSARRYHENGILRLQVIFTAIYVLHNAGIPQEELKRFYIDWIVGRPVV
jgi:rSAM/selenodomain-associated transferase 2